MLGGFELTIGDVAVDQFAVRPRARKTLHMLALHVGQPVHRDLLAQAVWPDSPPDAARRSVHVAISSLRHLLEPDAGRGQSLLLRRLGDSYSLALPDGSHCDLLDFRAALSSARSARLAGDVPTERASLRRALDGYSGDLMPEDGSAEWVVAERERLRLAAAAAAGSSSPARRPRPAISPPRRRRPGGRCHSTRTATARGGCSSRLHEQAADLSAAQSARQQYARVLSELGAVSPAELLPQG